MYKYIFHVYFFVLEKIFEKNRTSNYSLSYVIWKIIVIVSIYAICNVIGIDGNLFYTHIGSDIIDHTCQEDFLSVARRTRRSTR